MTYGVYTEDLQFSRLNETNMEACERWLAKGYVICTEKQIPTGLRVVLHFHWWRKPHNHKWCNEVELGFVSVEWRKTSYNWADKIVKRYGESGVAK